MPTATLVLRCQAGGGWPVYVDGVKVARILPGQTIELPVEPGDHRLRLGDGWRRSRELSIIVPSGREARFVCRRIVDADDADVESSTWAPVIDDIEGPYLVARELGAILWHHNWIVVEPEELPSRPGWAIERDPSLGADNYAQAPGIVCGACDRPIRSGQPARRREAGWAHDVCPPATLSGPDVH